MGFFVTRHWRLSKVMIALFVIEFALTVPMLALAGIADGDTYRTGLWENGSALGFNSNPDRVIYAAANHEPYSPPIVWSSFTVQFDIIAAVLSMFLLLAKSAMYVMHVFVPVLSVFVHAGLIAIYAVALRNQSAPDLSDPEHPARGLPWMMSKGCKYATASNVSYCKQAVALFAVTICLLAAFSIYFLISLWSCWPTAKERATRNSDIELRNSVFATFKSQKQQEHGGSGPNGRETDEERAERWERNRQLFLNMPKTPATPGYSQVGYNPMTPRTVAFTQLNGRPPTSKQMEFSQRELPFRKDYV